jgi:urea transport system ATP-binding protein
MIDQAQTMTSPSLGDGTLLLLKNATVVFDGFKALDIEQFQIARNELRVVIGPNGAGKTTLCDVISAKTRLSEGNVFFDGLDITRSSEFEIARHGIGRKFQTPIGFGSLTVYENVELALPGSHGVLENIFKRPSQEMKDEILEVLESVGLAESSNLLAQRLSHGQMQSLEIAMLLIAKPKLLLVDEPAAGLSDAESSGTAELLLQLKGRHTMIVIEHDMDFVRQLDSQVTVLNEGRILAEGPMQEVQLDALVIEAYLGR